MTRTRTMLAAIVGGLLFVLTGVGVVPAATAAELREVTDFGPNPGNIQMHVYVPDSLPAAPGVLVAMHGCGGSGPGFYSGSNFAALADQYGFIVIYPTATKQTAMSNCFDVWSDESKQRGGGSDPASIASMVDHVLTQHDGDPERVFVTGSSSGGMETNAMLALYPDLFAAGAVFMGVPFTCFLNEADFAPGGSQCVNGSKDQTPQQWGDAVRAAYPDYSGPRPRVQLWHGDQDPLIPHQLLQEEMEQWTDVFGLGQTPTSTDQAGPGWNRANYADGAGQVLVESISVQGAGHTLPQNGMESEAIAFFGLDGPGDVTPSPTTSPTPTDVPTDTPTDPGTAPADACSATVRVVNSWGSGWQADVDVSAGERAISGWQLTWTLADGQSVDTAWNAEVSVSGSTVTATNVAWNGEIAAGETLRSAFGFVGAGSTALPTVTCAAR